MSVFDSIGEVLGQVGDFSKDVQEQIAGWQDIFGGVNSQAETPQPNPAAAQAESTSPDPALTGKTLDSKQMLLIGGAVLLFFLLARK